MKVRLTEKGGWTNVRTGCTVDTANLPAEMAQALEDALAHAHIFGKHADHPNARDARTVDIEVKYGDCWIRASFSEAALLEGASEILQILRPLCEPIPAPRHR